MLKILQAPKSVLAASAKPVSQIDNSVKKLIYDMEKTLASASDPEGVGLAAPQIGKSLQIFLIKQNPRAKTQVFINPIIEKYIDDEEDEDPKITGYDNKNTRGVQLEGCLSLYSIWGEVKRHSGVVLSYTDISGKRHKKKFRGFIATIIQHEDDHLHGILFPKRVIEQKGQLYKSVVNKKGETEFEGIDI